MTPEPTEPVKVKTCSPTVDSSPEEAVAELLMTDADPFLAPYGVPGTFTAALKRVDFTDDSFQEVPC
jgi:hypothetical protein